MKSSSLMELIPCYLHIIFNKIAAVRPARESCFSYSCRRNGVRAHCVRMLVCEQVLRYRLHLIQSGKKGCWHK